MLDVFEKGENTTVPPTQARSRPRNRAGKRKRSTDQEDIPVELRPDRRITPLHQTKQSRGIDPKSRDRKSISNDVFQKEGWQT